MEIDLEKLIENKLGLEGFLVVFCLYYKKNIPQTEKDFIAAHCNYTVTKWVGEMGCNNQDLILRPRLFFGDFKDRNNLLCKLPKFKRFLTELNSYTSLDILVDAINVLLKENESGIFNVAGEGYATVMDLAEYIGFYGEGISEKELHDSEKLYLINNIMDISKLKRFYNPPKLKDEVLRCWGELK